jgi:hypothetical protein
VVGDIKQSPNPHLYVDLEVAPQEQILVREESRIETQFSPVVGREDDVCDEVTLIDVLLPGELMRSLVGSD